MKQDIEKLIAAAVAKLPAIAEKPELQTGQPEVERTRDPRHGDYASNVAMQLAKSLRTKPRELAEAIIARMASSELVSSVEVAGPGFINFRLSPTAYHRELQAIADQQSQYGQSQSGQGRRVLVEYVSANPTGPLHVGHGRHAAYGATVSNLLAATGHRVHQEYYVNDAGRQMDILAVSVWLRMFEHVQVHPPFPKGGYHGQYVVDIASDALQQFRDAVDLSVEEVFFELPPDGPDGDADTHLDSLIERARSTLGADLFLAILEFARDAILLDIRSDLEEFGVSPDSWFSEQRLIEDGIVQRALDRVSQAGNTYQSAGATWFRATDYGDEKDRVVVRENGRTTYFASDIAYHMHKRERGFDLLLDVLGADHHGYVARVRAGLEAMGEPPDCLEVNLVQFVALFRGERKIQMSTRSGDFVTLRELREEVGADAARLFYVSRSNDQHLDFDLELAKSQSSDNPVYYIQYAHARICSVMRELDSRGLSWQPANSAQLERLVEDHENTLMQTLTRYPETVENAARQRAPQHLVNYLRDLAHDLHTYYNAHRFIVDDAELRDARLMLIYGTRQVLRNGLGVLGVSAPEIM